MPLAPARDHRFPVADAIAMTKRYRESVPKGTFRAGYFHTEAFTTLLNQRGCRGIRIYLGRHEDGTLNLIMVGVNRHGNDMVRTTVTSGDVVALSEGDDDGGEVMQDSFPCPTLCPDGSPLGGDE